MDVSLTKPIGVIKLESTQHPKRYKKRSEIDTYAKCWVYSLINTKCQENRLNTRLNTNKRREKFVDG